MKIRAFLTILFSLILGFIIGFFVSQELVRYKVKDVQSMSSYETFKSRTHAIIEPDEQQKLLIDPIIDEFSEKLSDARTRMRKEYHDIIQLFHSELHPFLTEDQMKRLEEFPKHIKHRKKDTIKDTDQSKDRKDY